MKEKKLDLGKITISDLTSLSKEEQSKAQAGSNYVPLGTTNIRPLC
jgi:hypothetical protein